MAIKSTYTSIGEKKRNNFTLFYLKKIDLKYIGIFISGNLIDPKKNILITYFCRLVHVNNYIYVFHNICI